MESPLIPSSIEAEKNFLGSVLIDPDVLSTVNPPAEAFFREAHQAIYVAMRVLWDSGSPVDYSLLAHELQRAGRLDEVGGYAALTDLIAATPTAMYAAHYAKVVEDTWRLRRYIAMSQEGVKRAYEKASPSELAAWYAEQLRLIEFGAATSDITFWEDSFPEFQAELDRVAEEVDSGVGGWSWPWPSWNSMFGEAQPGMVIYLAGATGQGKTSYAENIVEHWARLGKRIVFVHLELNKKIMYARRATRHTGIDSRFIVANKLNPEQRAVIDRADEKMLEWVGGIHYFPAPKKSSEEICTELRKLHAAGQCDGFVVDYMQKVAASPNQLRRFRGSNADIQIQADHMENFKNLAEQEELRALILGQLTKEGNGDIGFEELDLKKLRGTQEIADKVNGIALFHRELLPGGMVDHTGRQIVEPGGASRTVRIRIAKNTLGPKGVIEQYMIPERFLVSDLTRKPLN